MKARRPINHVEFRIVVPQALTQVPDLSTFLFFGRFYSRDIANTGVVENVRQGKYYVVT